jgi:hypothetical protein
MSLNAYRMGVSVTLDIQKGVVQLHVLYYLIWRGTKNVTIQHCKLQ